MKLSKKHYILLGILCLLVITNPSITAFKAHQGANSYEGLSRQANFFIFSKYQDNYGFEYIGVLGNFFDLPINSTVTTDSVKVDSNKTALPTADTAVNIKELPYKERVYYALKDNLKNFNTPLSEFKEKIKDKSYALRVYSALKDNLTDFNKTQDQFLTSINK